MATFMKEIQVCVHSEKNEKEWFWNCLQGNLKNPLLCEVAAL
jgi:hypothetical protein